jgi:hypothetical protein
VVEEYFAVPVESAENGFTVLSLLLVIILLHRPLSCDQGNRAGASLCHDGNVSTRAYTGLGSCRGSRAESGLPFLLELCCASFR